MDSDVAMELIEARAREIERRVSILKSTMDRRLPPDEPMDNAISEVELACRVLLRTIEQSKEKTT